MFERGARTSAVHGDLLRDPERLARFYVAATRLSAARTVEGVLRRLAHDARGLAGADQAELTVVADAPSVGGRTFRAGTAAGPAARTSLEHDITVHGHPYAKLRLTTARASLLPVESELVALLCVHGSLAIEKLTHGDEAEVLARVRQVVGVAEPSHSELAVRDVGDIHLDLARYQAAVAGRPVHLTPSEFRLLELLTEEPGRAYGRHEIAARLWETDSPTSLRIADAHVARLRRKIEADPMRPERVLTVRGVGYRLAAE